MKKGLVQRRQNLLGKALKEWPRKKKIESKYSLFDIAQASLRTPKAEKDPASIKLREQQGLEKLFKQMPEVSLFRQAYLASPRLIDGRFLLFAIDITEPKRINIELVERFIDTYGKNPVERRKRKKKETEIDPWLVYDLHRYKEMNFADIARKISGLKGNPTQQYYPELSAFYKKVNRAYNRAQEIIRHAEGLERTIE